MINEKDKFVVVISPESRPDDQFCLCGTKENVAKAFVQDMECSMNARTLDKIPTERTLFWVTYDKKNWAGSGWGASDLFTNMKQVKEYILNKIKEDYLDIGEVNFKILPVFRVTDETIKITENHQNKLDMVMDKLDKIKGDEK